MQYYYDINGWISYEPIPGRSTNIAPNGSITDLDNDWMFTGKSWIEMRRAPLPEEPVNVSVFLKQVDTDTDYIYGSVVGNRSSEYLQAEADATAFNANPTMQPPSSVTSWANAKGWSNAQAAEDIISTALFWKQVQSNIRANRLATKEKAKLATNQSELISIKQAWIAFVKSIKSQLGIS